MGSLGPFEIMLLALVLPVLYVWSLVWAYKDAERRGSSGPLVVLMAAIAAWPLSLIIWVFVRPDR